MKRVAGLVLLLLLPATPSAHADGGRFRDPDEKPFCEGADPCPDTDYIDFRRLTYGHGDRARVVRHGVHARKGWKTGEMGGRRGVTIYFYLDVDGDAYAERQLRVRRKHGELWGRMFRGKFKDIKVHGRVGVWRPDRKTLKVSFSVASLGDDVDRYRWQAGWYKRSVYCPGSCHEDHAPQQGWFEHRL